jgi:hypothetical protein
MLDVVTTSFYMKDPIFEEESFERYSNQLFEEWERYIANHLHLSDYAVTLVVEEGSIKGLGKIGASLLTIYTAIGIYGSFISGVQIIEKQASQITKALFDEAKHKFACKSSLGDTRQSGGEIHYLKSLFERVQSGKLTPDQAISDVQDRWGDEASHSPELAKKFFRDLGWSLANAPMHPEQILMTDEFWAPCGEPGVPARTPKPRFPRPPRPLIPQQYRIEISRPEKRGQKKVKLTKL